ncbi:hypothetical protein [Phenylobacterium sp.]|uniref:hypothetical protein n=1 Tax=Phenylobacterium sp. TaxID=1871053 RepID=UPI003520BE68
MTTFLTGVTEPIEFSFMFLAPVLYAIHALLTGLSFIVMSVLDVKLGFGFGFGFGFSAGLVDARTTRLRLILVDQKAVNEQALKELGSRGMVRPSDKALQVVVGPIADQVAGEMRGALVGQSTIQRPASKSPSHPIDLDRWAAALGGRDNILQAELRAGRICAALNDASAVDEPALLKLGARGLAWPSASSLQILLKPTL